MKNDHRVIDYLTSHHALVEPHEIPDGATLPRFGRFWKADDAPPPGFAKKQLPLMRVSYSHGFKRMRRQICCYRVVRERFTKELCEKFMANTVYIKPY
jgi:hypothetical protein